MTLEEILARSNGGKSGLASGESSDLGFTSGTAGKTYSGGGYGYAKPLEGPQLPTGYNQGYQSMGVSPSDFASYTPAEQAGIQQSYEGLGDTGPTTTPGMTGFQMGGLALGGLNALLGYKNYGLAKDTFAHNKKMAEANYAANQTQANNAIDSVNTRNTVVNNKANAMSVAGGGLASQTYTPKARVKDL